MGFIKNKVLKWLGFQPAQQKSVRVIESLTHADQLMVNRVWYRGDPGELGQLYKSLGPFYVNESRFWTVVPPRGQTIRKIHTGLPQLIIDMLNDITNDDFLGVNFDEDESRNPEETIWDEIALDNRFDDLRKEATQKAMVDGDCAFKVTIDPEVSPHPIIEVFGADEVDYAYERGRLKEIIFHTYMNVNDKVFRLDDIYGYGYIDYKLYNEDDKEVDLATLDETADLERFEFEGDFIMGVPVMLNTSSKFKNRGKGLLETKYDTFDALDEVVSQWLDEIRLGRATKFIPESLIPRDGEGNRVAPNPMTNQFYTYEQPRVMSEGDTKTNEPHTVQPDIRADQMLSSYIQYLDMALMGIISPSTLGIDVKKLDNSEAQREKEKATLYTRNKLIKMLQNAIPALVKVVMKTHDIISNEYPGEYDPTIEFGGYANPSFEAVVETVGKAKQYGIMSTEQAVNELYGDSMKPEDKALEVERIKSEASASFEQELDPMDNNPFFIDDVLGEEE